MPPGSYKILLIFYLMKLLRINATSSEQQTQPGRALFSPRVDYNEWMPVGHGDPLKNDPTYDYSPPVSTLDRVRYWADAGKSKEKNDVLLLGIPSKKPSSRKDIKYYPVRRNYYSPLPTRLMPPPMTNQHSNMEIYSSGGWPSRKNVNLDASFDSFSTIHPNTYNQKNGAHIQNYVQTETYFNKGLYNINMEQPRPFETQTQLKFKDKKPFLHTILQKESLTTQTLRPPTSNYYSTNSFVIMPSIEVTTPSQPIQTSTYFTPTVLPSLTTPSLFSHYNQPEQPITGPMYLIIQGHSKVKTYGQSNETSTVKHPPNIVPIISTEDPVVHRVISKDENDEQIIVKHLHKKQENKIDKKNNKKESPSAIGTLLSLLDSSFGNFMLDNQNETHKNTKL